MSSLNNKVLEIIEPAPEMNETEGDVKESAKDNEVDESKFFATGTFSIHHQPGNDDDVYMGE